ERVERRAAAAARAHARIARERSRRLRVFDFVEQNETREARGKREGELGPHDDLPSGFRAGCVAPCPSHARRVPHSATGKRSGNRRYYQTGFIVKGPRQSEEDRRSRTTICRIAYDCL